ncbi:MAG TPA: hypothetical protein VF624_14190 [Tepidisphaeraceae bacterium]|jgi:hypothetical protein
MTDPPTKHRPFLNRKFAIAIAAAIVIVAAVYPFSPAGVQARKMRTMEDFWRQFA